MSECTRAVTIESSQHKDVGYSVKGAKTFHGHDGYGWECKLHEPRTGRKIGIVVDDGFGGGLQFHGVSNEDMEALREFCKTLPKWKSTIPADDGSEVWHDTDADIYLCDLVHQFLDAKDLKAWVTRSSRSAIMFQLDEYKPDGSYKTLKRKAKVSDKEICGAEEKVLVAHIQEKYGDRVACIVGLRTMDNIIN